MLTFLFWNLNKLNLAENIARLVALHQVDVLILAEVDLSTTSVGDLLRALKVFHYAPDPECPRIQIFTRFASDYLSVVRSRDRYSIRSFKIGQQEEMLVVAAHLISLTNTTKDTLNEEAKLLAQGIKEVENERGHSRTVLVGDLNLNPFDDGVVSARGLHGVMDKRIAAKRERTVRATPYPFFYNPMWNCFGDKEGRPPGTYYYRSSDHICYFWNVFDQVLVRPDLLEKWVETSLVIPITDGVVSFLSQKGLPGGKGKSDHLPLVFGIEL